MKKTMTLIACCLVFGYANAQEVKEADVPAAAKEAFAKKYPGVKAEEWEKEGNDYEVEFHLDKIESSATFEANGTFKELEQEIKTSELPKAAIDYCASKFAGYKLAEAEKITDANGNISFEAEMEKDKEHFDVLFDDKGNFLKKIAPEPEDDKKK